MYKTRIRSWAYVQTSWIRSRLRLFHMCVCAAHFHRTAVIIKRTSYCVHQSMITSIKSNVLHLRRCCVLKTFQCCSTTVHTIRATQQKEINREGERTSHGFFGAMHETVPNEERTASTTTQNIWFNLIRMLMKVHYIGRVSWVNLKLSTFCYFHSHSPKTNISTSTLGKTLRRCREFGNMVHTISFLRNRYISPPFRAHVWIVAAVAVVVISVRVAIELSIARQLGYLCKIYFVN